MVQKGILVEWIEPYTDKAKETMVEAMESARALDHDDYHVPCNEGYST